MSDPLLPARLLQSAEIELAVGRSSHARMLQSAAAEIARLEAVNAELLTAMEILADKPRYDRDSWVRTGDKVIFYPWEIAKGALSKAASVPPQPRAADASTPPES